MKVKYQLMKVLALLETESLKDSIAAYNAKLTVKKLIKELDNGTER